MRTLITSLLILTLIIPVPSYGCAWDDDTLFMEESDFPGAHELIAGYFNRHSPAFYEWRVESYTQLPELDFEPTDYDNLAVAYEKLEKHQQAIDTIRKKIDKFPEEGRYESEANLGTFLIHDGRYEEGLKHISRAIEINRHAHFGREIYQQRLVEYVIQQRTKGLTLPLADTEGGFGDYILAKSTRYQRQFEQAKQKAVKGLLGMMRFGNHDSPILLEALADVMSYEGGHPESFHVADRKLAARAYLKASYHATDDRAEKAYREKAAALIDPQWNSKLEDIEEHLKQEIEQGVNHAAEIAKQEAEWIAADLAVDEKFRETFAKEPKLSPYIHLFDPNDEDRASSVKPPNWKLSLYSLSLSIALFALIALLGILYVVRNANQAREHASQDNLSQASSD